MKTTQYGFSPDGENFKSTPNRVLTTNTEWLLGVRLRHSVPPAVYIKIMGAGGYPVVVPQWYIGSRPSLFPLLFAS